MSFAKKFPEPWAGSDCKMNRLIYDASLDRELMINKSALCSTHLRLALPHGRVQVESLRKLDEEDLTELGVLHDATRRRVLAWSRGRHGAEQAAVPAEGAGTAAALSASAAGPPSRNLKADAWSKRQEKRRITSLEQEVEARDRLGGRPQAGRVAERVPPVRKEAGCEMCGAHASKVCSRCKQVAYCGAECQQAHWPEHKKMCKAADT